MNGSDNLGYENGSVNDGGKTIVDRKEEAKSPQSVETERATWGNSIEFLMSCIALSIGFGNVWRFPFTAYENGGGAFLIPYIIVLFLIGKPFYYLEMIIGQFCSSSHIKVWRISPGFKGVGWAQMCSLAILASYYCSLMALNLFYLFASFASELPWARCREEWGENCVDSGIGLNRILRSETNSTANSSSFGKTLRSVDQQSSAELYFLKEVLKEYDNIDNGIGLPDWRLTLCLLGSWACICAVLSRGVKSTGKASYFLAIFPYVIMIALLIRASTLDGAGNGILFFITPDWEKILDPQVWYAAITQCFFSLSVCFGSIIMYSSHNEFRHNIYRDAMIVTTLDTFTSMMAGCTIFGILGNLAYETGSDDISTVVRGGTGLAFVSYPDAIAKFNTVPQLFSVLFFTMMFVLGIGSGVGMSSGIITGLCDQFPNLKRWQVMIGTAATGFAFGTVYVTPGGQFILTLVDYYGASFIVFILATFEIIGIIWVYGLENFLEDIEFMLDRKVGMYWRLCWFLIVPLALIGVFIYTTIEMTPLTYGDVAFPPSAHAAGWTLTAIGVLQIPIWMAIALMKYKNLSFKAMVQSAFRPAAKWGPRLTHHRQEWLIFKDEKARQGESRTQSWFVQKLHVLFNIEETKSKT
ncbi:sodium-dependent nutrient amino acid transporter 1-like [Neodiprion fabricii]|uniref:sodium-dependent nutrient amino acid transporter 1-like n=1 Tax=Neodiprion fabricii TaxID=2872261 RepID=UPI001ED979CD|nr:sodium-dependent nutrient amino acid transporter 1-like [Neodiprion fabricii]XP_046428318.1 sodium-dependent nutrient amino acid transporter 1-like [Neodiprion fabricii]